MLNRDLESLNLKTRIVKKIRLGLPGKQIAFEEGVSQQYVSHVALEAGIRRYFRKIGP